jgi:hypothetical protein
MSQKLLCQSVMQVAKTIFKNISKATLILFSELVQSFFQNFDTWWSCMCIMIWTSHIL